MTNEKIKKLQLEIAKTTEAQKKSEQKYKEKIRGLRDELKKEEERLKRENDSLIGDIVKLMQIILIASGRRYSF